MNLQKVLLVASVCKQDSNLITLKLHQCISFEDWRLVRITFCATLDNGQYPAVFPPCSVGSWNRQCTVTPPTLFAASPVGAATAQVVSSPT